MSVKRYAHPGGIIRLRLTRTAYIIEGDIDMRFHNRFICVGVDISVMRYSQGDGANTSLSRITYCTHVLVLVDLCFFPVCVWVSSLARSCATKDANNKENVWKPSIPAGIKCPPPSKTVSPITWFGAISIGGLELTF